MTEPTISDHVLTVGKIHAKVDDLYAAIHIWTEGDDRTPHVRAAASDAINAIDFIVQQSHRLRGDLIVEARRSDDAAMKR